MLDLADAVIERVHGPVLFLCLARPELVEQRPTWAAGKPRCDHDDPPAARTGGRPHDRRAVARRKRPRVRRRPDLRDGRGESALPGAAHGDARGSRASRRRPLAGVGRCRRGNPGVVAGAPRRQTRPPRPRTAPDPRASIHRRPPVPDRGSSRARRRAGARRGRRRDLVTRSRRPDTARRTRRPGGGASCTRWSSTPRIEASRRDGGRSSTRSSRTGWRLRTPSSPTSANRLRATSSARCACARNSRLRDAHSAALSAARRRAVRVGGTAGIRRARLHHESRPPRPRRRVAAGV